MRETMYTSGEYLRRNPTWHTEDSAWKARQIIRILEKNKLQPDSICEVGCGAGETLNQLYQQLPNHISFFGYEISPQAYELCQQRQKERLQFFLKDLLPDDSNQYDIVLAMDVFEHIEDCFSFLRELRPKGRYKIFHIPLEMSGLNVLRGVPIMKARRDLGHIHYFAKETALATLEESDYDVVDYFYTAGATELPARSFKSRLAKFPRKMMYRVNKDLAVRMFGGYSLLVLTR